MAYSYTTTPEQRVGPGPPYSNTSMEINLFFRVFLGLVANIAYWVPMRVLWKNGEFAASVWCVINMILNVYYVVNALIWRNDNVQTWFDGRGWCDLQIYTVYPFQTIYAACVFTIMHNLATKVGMMRATSLSSSEKRRRNIREALILFIIPLLQVIMTYFVLEQRFNVATLIGCRNIYHRNWVYVIIFNFPIPIFTILAVFFSSM
jgi:pheromone a factor receptor